MIKSQEKVRRDKDGMIISPICPECHQDMHIDDDEPYAYHCHCDEVRERQELKRKAALLDTVIAEFGKPGQTPEQAVGECVRLAKIGRLIFRLLCPGFEDGSEDGCEDRSECIFRTPKSTCGKEMFSGLGKPCNLDTILFERDNEPPNPEVSDGEN